MTVPTYVDLKRLAFELCSGESTIEELIAKGQFPPPCRLKANGKRLWRWDKVQEHLEKGSSIDPVGDSIYEATKRIAGG
jgi:hypothetical protein